MLFDESDLKAARANCPQNVLGKKMINKSFKSFKVSKKQKNFKNGYKNLFLSFEKKKLKFKNGLNFF